MVYLCNTTCHFITFFTSMGDFFPNEAPKNPPGVEGEDKPVIQSPSARMLQGLNRCSSRDVCQHDYSADSDVANELALHSSALNTDEEVQRFDSTTLDHSGGAVLLQ